MSNYLGVYGSNSNDKPGSQEIKAPKRKKYEILVRPSDKCTYIIIDEDKNPVIRSKDEMTGECKFYETNDVAAARAWVEMLRRKNVEDLGAWQSIDAALSATNNSRASRAARSLSIRYRTL